MRDESDLIRAAAAGDRKAFEVLVRLKRERVVRTAWQVTGDLEDARDVAQGVFLRLWRSLDRFEAGRRFDTWLYRMTVNAAIDHLRSRGPRGVLQPFPAGRQETWRATPGADDAVAIEQLREAFRTLAARLAPRQRAAFVLKEIEGLEIADVARILGIADSTVRNLLLQARRALRIGLERDYPSLVPGRGRSGGAGGEDR
jgi:RNA polymerase sigma-70 factor, ECF subfamily